ncbi:MAG: hypothetical protein MJZ27_06280 [Bacteroidales bacterium]|nr:hypothetical protein [Bacteroidales bacterium]
MSTISILNIVILNIIAWVVFSYFWGGWTFHLYKPHRWLELKNKKLINKQILNAESNIKDKNRLYCYWMLQNQIDEQLVPGDVLFAGVEELDFIKLAHYINPERQIVIVDPLSNKDIHITKENCQGEVSEQDIHLNNITKEDLDKSTVSPEKLTVFQGKVSEQISNYTGTIASAWVDCVDQDDLSASLSHIYRHLAPSGIIFIHDYNHNWETVELAVNRFLLTIPESFISLPDMYGTIAVIKNK